jgi:hypothetical protein
MPLNRGSQLVLAQRNYEAALSAYGTNASPPQVSAVQKAAEAYIRAAMNMWGRQSAKYARVVERVVAQLEKLQRDAARQAAGENDLTSQLKSGESEIQQLLHRREELQKAASDATSAIREEARQDIEAEKRQRDQTVIRIRAAARAAIETVQHDLAIVMQGITQMRNALMLCPVCFYPDLEEPPREFSICPCCGTEFGVDDYSPRGISPDVIHRDLRWQWLERGAPWFDPETPKPDGWRGSEQVWNSPYWLRTATSAAPTLHRTVRPNAYIVDARVLTYA